MEDWGWVMGFKAKSMIFLIKLWGPREIQNEWTLELSVKAKHRFFSKRDNRDENDSLNYFKTHIERIISNEKNVIRQVKWLEASPL